MYVCNLVHMRVWKRYMSVCYTVMLECLCVFSFSYMLKMYICIYIHN